MNTHTVPMEDTLRQQIVQNFRKGDWDSGMSLLRSHVSQGEEFSTTEETDRVLGALSQIAHSTNSPAVYLAIQFVKRDSGLLHP